MDVRFIPPAPKFSEAWQSLAYCVGLENRRTFARSVGSNPTASSERIIMKKLILLLFVVFSFGQGTGPYYNELNPFTPEYGQGSSDQTGQCTWYAFGRAAEQNKDNVELYIAFAKPGNRHAKYWPRLLKPSKWIYGDLPINMRSSNYIVCWDFGRYGHVAYVEAVSPDKTKFLVSYYNAGGDRSFHTKWILYSEAEDGMGPVRWYKL